METAHTHASALFDAHMQAELAGDLDATMETMVENPHLINLEHVYNVFSEDTLLKNNVIRQPPQSVERAREGHEQPAMSSEQRATSEFEAPRY